MYASTLTCMDVMNRRIRNLPRTLLTKDLEFKKLVIPQILPKLGYGAAAIGMALSGFGV